MSPPSLATAGRTRVSMRSLIVATVSASAASKNSSPSLGSVAPAASNGAPDMKCSMMAPRIIGLSCCHSPEFLVTVMKSEPKNTPLTPAMPNSRSASGDCAACSASRRSSVSPSSTARPGRNFRVAGFGVASVWMNIFVCPQSLGAGPMRPRHDSYDSTLAYYYVANCLGSSSAGAGGRADLRPHKTDDILDRLHGFAGELLGAGRAVREHGIDCGGVVEEP